MAHANDSNVFISGPMTGIPDYNRTAFEEAANTLRKYFTGKVFNPAEGHTDDGHIKHHEEYMCDTIGELVGGGYTLVVMLPGWETSEGAKVEHDVADAIGIETITYDSLVEEIEEEPRTYWLGGARDGGTVAQMQLINGDCKSEMTEVLRRAHNPIIVSDPPFNIGYHYGSYKDKLPEDEYFSHMAELFSAAPSVVIHYPEGIIRLSMEMGIVPERVVSWVYNSNTARQHRDIAFFGVKPDFGKIRQPYKNPNDKRIRERIAQGKTGAKLYDWWNVNQVKNVSKEKTGHPCQMPVEVMTNIIGILPDGVTVIDPFMGSGTTGEACRELGVDFIGIEIDPEYFSIAQRRLLGGD